MDVFELVEEAMERVRASDALTTEQPRALGLHYLLALGERVCVLWTELLHESMKAGDEPLRSPSPCCDDCGGWFVCCESLQVQRCDDCWRDVEPWQMTDELYAHHPACQQALAKLLAETPVLEGPEECEDNDCMGCAWCDLNLCADCGERTDSPGQVHTCPARQAS